MIYSTKYVKLVKVDFFLLSKKQCYDHFIDATNMLSTNNKTTEMEHPQIFLWRNIHAYLLGRLTEQYGDLHGPLFPLANSAIA
jgi:hypothetical protein